MVLGPYLVNSLHIAHLSSIMKMDPQNQDKEQLIRELLPQPMRVQISGVLLHSYTISISEENQCSK